MTLPPPVPVELLPDPDVAAAALLARSRDPRLAAALADLLAGGTAATAASRASTGDDEHPFDGFVASTARRLDGLGGRLGAAVAEVDDVEAGPGAAPFVGRVVSAAARLSRLTTRLTEYADACADALPVEVDVAALVPEAVARLEQAGRPAPPEVAVTGPALPLDPDLARLVLEHLLTNAASYAAGPVAVTTRRDPGGWQLVVTDHGPGIPAADRVRVLAPLVRLDRDRALAGDGMGLAICARVLRGHRGMVFVNRSPGGGTAVRLVGGLR